MAGSSIPRFFEKSRRERLAAVGDFADLSAADIASLEAPDGGITFEMADRMVENAVGTFALPMGVATNFRINGRDYLVPMVIEEPSVIAAASKAAKIARPAGGFTAEAAAPYSTGQIQVIGADGGPGPAADKIRQNTREILDAANAKSRTLSGMGRGAKEVSCRAVGAGGGADPMLVVELLVDVGDAMGANITNAMCEAAAPVVERVTGGTVLLRILSNYSTRRTIRATAVFGTAAIGGPPVADRMIDAYRFARDDVYRAVTHNKGIMNGVVAVANATGQDSRAIEAAAHAYAARSGRYRSLSEWAVNGDGNLVGTLEIPLAVGTVGGIVNVHPVAGACVRMLGAKSAGELGCVIASAGLAQNFAAMLALATDGIQRGHMRLHARNLAAAAGASSPGQVDRVVSRMVEEGDISAKRARELVDKPPPGT